MFCPRLSENFPLSFYFFENAWGFQKVALFNRKK